ncbi:hypothetical protein [Agrobacterium salinitolerans]|uniref:hypothetical protein n=1 Tax=Agrobacterium salinitolerans TaxID=1183413 RepID=UPI0020B2E79F|nr:hypothetical protein [Agrobacterium salinitolerans]
MPFTLEPDIVDRGVVPDAGDDVLQLPPARLMKQHVIGDDGFDLEPCRHVGDLMQTQRHSVAGADRDVSDRQTAQPSCEAARHRHPADPAQECRSCLRVSHDVIPMQDAVVLAATRFAESDEARQARIGGSVHRIDQHRHAIREIEPTADDEPNAC